MQFKKRTNKRIIAIALATFVLSSSAFMYSTSVKADEQVEVITSQQAVVDGQSTSDAEVVTTDASSQQVHQKKASWKLLQMKIR